MEIILLSGGSGKRLWPLSNDTRSKQFLKLLPAPNGTKESMVQRIARQISEAEIDANITIATSITQRDAIMGQLGRETAIVVEPERRDTFPAIALATSHLHRVKGCSRDEVVVVMPTDPFTELSYFDTIAKMAKGIEQNCADMVLMGIAPTEPSTKFGYIVPDQETLDQPIVKVSRFTEKPDIDRAKELIAQGAIWNGGVFAFRLGYLIDIVEQYIKSDSFDEILSRYSEFPKISFDYEVVERAKSVGVVTFEGTWEDLGTWDSLSHRIDQRPIGNVTTDKQCNNSTIINELDIPIIALSAEDMVIAASPDGILVGKRESTVELKTYADSLKARPMYEERRWGTYKVMGQEVFSDGSRALTKLLHINSGCSISYQYHNKREEIWTFVDGTGELIIDGVRSEVGRGCVAHIKAGQKHAVRATSDMQIIEVQTGAELVEDDIIRLDWQWE